MTLSKSLFFPARKEWCTFHKISDFSCSGCVKRVFFIAFVWKYTPFWSAAVAESTVMRQHPVYYKYDRIAGFIFYLRLAAMRWVPTNEFPAIISPFCSSEKEENQAWLIIKYPSKVLMYMYLHCVHTVFLSVTHGPCMEPYSFFRTVYPIAPHLRLNKYTTAQNPGPGQSFIDILPERIEKQEIDH